MALDQKAIVQDVSVWIEKHLHQRLLVTDVANIAGYSPYHFQRMFKKITGENLAKYIKEKKLNAARDELLKGMSVLDIVFKYGFDTQQEFTRSFKRRYKLPPVKYRKEMYLKLRCK